MSLQYVGLNEINGPLVVLDHVKGASYDEMVEIQINDGTTRLGRVVQIEGERVVVQVFEGTNGLSLENTKTRLLGKPMELPVSKEILGRIFSGAGRPIDGLGEIYAEEQMDINGLPLNPVARVYPRNYINTGISSIDCLATLIRGQKLQRLRKAMKDCNHHIITSLDDIVWLFNIRGNDVPCNPVVLSYALINQEDAYLYVQDGVIDAKIEAILKRDSIYIKNYNDIYDDVEKLTGKVLLDKQIVNYEICRRLNCEIVNGPNPTQLFKAIKNKTEIEATKYAHIKDGVAVTKFMYWLKTNVGKIPMDEVSISDKLEEFRKAQKDFYDLSFDTICAYKENAALMHYKAEPGKCATVTNEGLLLIDSGGQYFDGTTDITRTFVLGNISDIERRDYTVALKALLRLQDARFIAGTTGPNLDLFAREMVYKYNLDYRCGTGHGVGHFLNVHEGPNGFRPKDRPGSNAMCAFEPGMITTDEPGIYIENSHGVRHENELLCVETANNEYGQFLRFEPITMVPFDLDGLDLNLLSNHEIEQINEYHQLVFDTIAPYLTSEEKSWLQANLLIK